MMKYKKYDVRGGTQLRYEPGNENYRMVKTKRMRAKKIVAKRATNAQAHAQATKPTWLTIAIFHLIAFQGMSLPRRSFLCIPPPVEEGQ